MSTVLASAGSLVYAAGVVLAALLEDCMTQARTALRTRQHWLPTRAAR
jgi:hypothetical protein